MPKEFSPHLRIVLKEMCDRVGLRVCGDMEYFQSHFQQYDWFKEYSWSQKEEDDFTKWMTDYLFNNREARLDLTTCHYKNKKCCKAAAEQFVWNYGWIRKS